MNWITIAWSMVGAACLTFGLINLRVAIGQKHPAPYLFFFATWLAVASLAGRGRRYSPAHRIQHS
jgi:hypothetical protein